MAGEHTARGTRASREWRLGAVLIVLAVLVRSAILLIWPLAAFDSDQAITGLMAKHLAELRAFPVFYYGQNYMLAVEAWLAAPVFAAAGASVTALRVPLLLMNLAIALLLLRAFVYETGLRPAVATVPTLLFALASPGVSARLLDANGGNVEPLLYVVLLWLIRHRPRWCGSIFAMGFLQREFLLYGLVALLSLEAMQRTLFTREGLVRRGVTLRTAAVTWLTVQWVKTFSSAAGPGTTIMDVYRPHDNLTELASRICFDVRAVPSGIVDLFALHWPMLFGLRRQAVLDFGLDTTAMQGIAGGSVVLAAMLLLPIVVIGQRLLSDRCWRREYDFCAYLVLTALLSCAGYILGRCGQIGSVGSIRYEMLSLLGAAGVGAWALKVGTPVVRRAWIAIALAVVGVAAASHAAIAAQYLSSAPVSAKLLIARQLEARGVQYAASDYWMAYSVTFLTKERTKIASTDLVRIREYNRLVDAHPDETIRIAREPCPDGHRIMDGIYFCGP